jgi:hypothetical protein
LKLRFTNKIEYNVKGSNSQSGPTGGKGAMVSSTALKSFLLIAGNSTLSR